MTERQARGVMAGYARYVARVDRLTQPVARQAELLSATALVEEIAVRTGGVRRDKKVHAMALALREALLDMHGAPGDPPDPE